MDDMVQRIADLRRRKQLHTVVENRIMELASRVAPEFYPAKEPHGLAGGRNDLMLFDFSGRKVLFEVFATAGQVSRDLRILDKTRADVKIAVVIDREVDPRVLDRFLRENPESNYPFIFVSEFLADQPIECCLKLRQLITGDEESLFHRLLRRRLNIPGFVEKCRQEGIDMPDIKSVESGNVTFRQVFLALVAAKLRRLGVNQERLIALMRWMSDEKVERYAMMMISAGLNTFLYTDMGDTMAIYSDIDLLDWLAIGRELDKPYILLPLNALIYEMLDSYSLQDVGMDRSIKVTIGRSTVYDTPYGRQVDFSIPRNTRAIRVFRPHRPMTDDQDEITASEYKSMMEFL